MKSYTIIYRRVSDSKFSVGKLVDTDLFTATFAAPNETLAEKQLMEKEANNGLGRKIRIIKTIAE